MNTESVVISGARDVRGTLAEPDGGTDRAVVACPPHPQYGGNRQDRRLRAVADALVDRGVACLRIDYGEWDEGRGEQTDVHNSLRWVAERYESSGMFGYSFGSISALLVAADLGRAGKEADVDLAAVSALAPGELAVDGLADIECPVQLLYGTRDTTVDWEPVVERARERAEEGREIEIVEFSADHHFVGQAEKVAEDVTDFLVAWL